MTDITTSVDSLIKLVKEREQIPLADAAKELKVSEDTIHVWVDFLVEEKVLGLDYKLTTPIIFYVGKGKALDQPFNSAVQLKKEFLATLDKKLSPEEKEKKWRSYAINLLLNVKNHFYKEAHIRNLHKITDYAWQVFVVKFLK